jgi:uncharacterized protein (UPF0297 family)
MENPFEIINSRLKRIKKLLKNIYLAMEENKGNPQARIILFLF